MAVGLTTEITPDLRREGLAREIVHAVQNARRAAGLRVEERIVLHLDGSGPVREAIDAFGPHISAETLVERLSVGHGAPVRRAVYREELVLDGEPVAIRIDRPTQTERRALAALGAPAHQRQVIVAVDAGSTPAPGPGRTCRSDLAGARRPRSRRDGFRRSCRRPVTSSDARLVVDGLGGDVGERLNGLDGEVDAAWLGPPRTMAGPAAAPARTTAHRRRGS